MWTTGEETFQPRNHLVLESIFFHHPNAEVKVYATYLKKTFFQEYTRNGYSVQIERLNDSFIQGLGEKCPGQEWLNRLDEWKKGKYYYSHITDYLRFCLLYIQGGIYSDFDAILLNPFYNDLEFIGRDEATRSEGMSYMMKMTLKTSGPTSNEPNLQILPKQGGMSPRSCDWCLPGGNIYLAPGLMSAKPFSNLCKTALQTSFNKNYDPLIFNSVGPQAITKAYKLLSRDSIRLYDSHILYPYKYWEVHSIFSPHPNPQLLFNKLRRHSISLHLYGHISSVLPIQDESLLAHVSNTFSLLNEKDTIDIRVPEYIEISKKYQLLPDCRIIGSKSGEFKFNLTISVQFGSIAMKDSKILNSFSSTLDFKDLSTREANEILTSLVYLRHDLANRNSMKYSGRDQVFIKLSYKQQSLPISINKIVPILDISSLVTIISKTMDRMDKVFELVRSAHHYYPDIQIIVSDDGENVNRMGGPKKGFDYLPLPYDSGLSAGRNRMLDHVKTEYFLTVDDDFLFESESQIGELLWAVENEGCDLAGGKNPKDEERYGFDFAGLIKVDGNALKLEPGILKKTNRCEVVDIIPNLFLAKTNMKLRWDEQFKLGEHEDFFLRAKQFGLTVCTCPTVSFYHNQESWQQQRTKYDKMRSRVTDFWKMALEKHNLEKLISFGVTMLDLSR